MFFWSNEKKAMNDKLKIFELEILNLKRRIQWLEDTVYPKKEKEKPDAPYGLKKDGTPRAKPGRKSK